VEYEVLQLESMIDTSSGHTNLCSSGSRRMFDCYRRRKNVHHANDPTAINQSSREIRRCILCHAPLLHLLREPHAQTVERRKSTTTNCQSVRGLNRKNCKGKKIVQLRFRVGRGAYYVTHDQFKGEEQKIVTGRQKT